jgi:uncharacterized protein (TIGR02186 family)
MRALLILAAALLQTTPAAAEKLIVSLSNHRVLVTSSFTGEQLVLFGTIEPDTIRGPVRSNYDVVATVTGPPTALRTRRKDRILGVWINHASRQFIDVPSYLAVLANKPINSITDAETRRRLQTGLDNFILEQRVGPDFADTVPDDPFRAAFIRLQKAHGFYRENPAGVTFLTPTVFRAEIPLPATAPTGSYAVDVKVFANGQLIVRGTSALEVVKAGFEQFVATAAQHYGPLYGLFAALMALFTGWVASVVFRRD